MKFFAQEKENSNADWSDRDGVLLEEAEHVYRLYLNGAIREIYFNEDNCAVIILECENKKTAEVLLSEFPLVKAGLIYFELTQLKPYTGFKRLMKH